MSSDGESADTHRKRLEIESNEKIANQNLEFQKEKFQYDKDLQQQMFTREDNQYQRTVQDMRNAGLSPLAMQGTNGAGEAIATEAPHNDMHYDYMSGISNTFEKISALAGVVDSINNVRKSTAEIQNLRAQTANIETINDYNNQTMSDRVAQTRAQAIVSKYNALSLREKQYYNNFYGITDSMPEEQKLAKIAYIESLNEQQFREHAASHGGKDLRKFENSLEDFSQFTKYGTFDERNTRKAVKDVAQGAVKALSDSLTPAPSASEVDEYIEQQKKETDKYRKKYTKGGRKR